jgi:hypothetical protein
VYEAAKIGQCRRNVRGIFPQQQKCEAYQYYDLAKPAKLLASSPKSNAVDPRMTCKCCFRAHSEGHDVSDRRKAT